EGVPYAVAAVRALFGKRPIFGICLGHQIIGLALGLQTYKLKFGHHGANHPVLDLETRKVEITSQNHNFAVRGGEVAEAGTNTVSGIHTGNIRMLDSAGVISEKGSSNPLSESADLVARIKEDLTLAAEDSHIKALLLRINSPGGTVTASDVIHHEINEFKSKRKIPVVAVIMDIGASGGYYVAVAADQIIAHPTSVTGSVGVVMLRVNAEGLLQKIGGG